MKVLHLLVALFMLLAPATDLLAQRPGGGGGGRPGGGFPSGGGGRPGGGIPGGGGGRPIGPPAGGQRIGGQANPGFRVGPPSGQGQRYSAQRPAISGGASVYGSGRANIGGVYRGGNQTVYRNNLNIGQRTLNVAPNGYRPGYQNYAWHNGYWNNSYGWNPMIGYGRGWGGYGNYGGYGIRLGGLGLGLGGYGYGGYPGYGYGGYGAYGGYGYGRYPIGWGYAGWGLGNLLYRSGYMSYYNPYWTGGTGANYAYNYAQPIYVSTTESEQPSDGQFQDADAAVDAFKSGDYNRALELVDTAIRARPNDGVLHELRALTLFALRDYTSAAATIHSVLAVGPGWDWATMSSLYPDVAQYTAQLRALESFVRSNASDPAPQFLLGYHYMTTGYPENAAKQFQNVVKLQPKDQVARDLLNLVDKQPENKETLPPPASPDSAASPGATVPPPAAEDASRTISTTAIAGTWNSSRNDGGKFALDLKPDNTFTWKFDQGDKHEDFSGTYTTEGSLLILQNKDGGAMIGHVTPKGDNEFTFKMVGAPDEDPGLTFTK